MKIINKLTIAITFAVLFFTTTVTEVKAADAETLVVHYFRYEADYNQWALWIWPYTPDSGSGSEYSFTESDGFGQVATIDLADNGLDSSTSLGVLVKDPDWVKDISSDRYIDLTDPDINGEVHIYLVQNNPNIYYSEAAADTSNKILSATFDDENTISFSATAPTVVGDVMLYEDDILVSISNFNGNGNNGSFDIDSVIDLTKKYRLEIDFGASSPATSSVSFDGFYSSDMFNDQFGYDGELGAIYSETETTFKLWAPISDEITLNLYTLGHTASQEDYDLNPGVDTPYATHTMTLGEKGVWSSTIAGDLDGVYYTYTVENGDLVNEIVDPYAFAAGINGKRGMVIDFDDYDPTDWSQDERPDTMEAYTDAIIYEIHVRDLTSHETWTGTEDYRGTFLGLVEEGTTYQSVTTGFDHIKELGVTHVQLVPVFDHGIIDETRLDDESYYGIQDGIFNWGYMPENFNVLEGSYSTDPYNGATRTTEFKELVQSFHGEDIRVVMDVVYNHTGKSADSNFDIILPGYYYRMNSDGTFSNGSGTGNETASEHYMFQKYMVDSLTFWATEYNVDGFRFDLMKLHDVETMQKVTTALHAIDDTIMIYGEPWTGGTSPLTEAQAAYNANLDEMPGVAVFNDDTRDGIKGSVFNVGEEGFVQGNNFSDPRVLLGITGATLQTNLPTNALPKGAWAINPTQTINYATAHDNNTLHDKLVLSANPSTEDLIRMQRQANAIILTSQGIPFLHGGVEFLKSKPCTVIDGESQGECDSAQTYDHNSYRSPDDTNQYDYNDKVTNIETFNYYKGLIELRKMKDVFSLATTEEIADAIVLIPDQTLGFVSYMLHDENDLWQTTYILHNNGDDAKEVMIHPGTWNVVLTTDEIGEKTTASYDGDTVDTLDVLYVQEGGSNVTLETNETLVMYSTEHVEFIPDFMESTDSEPSGFNYLIPVLAVSGIALVGLGVVIFKRKFA